MNKQSANTGTQTNSTWLEDLKEEQIREKIVVEVDAETEGPNEPVDNNIKEFNNPLCL